METGAIVVSVVVGLFGVASAILGFVAEAMKFRLPDYFDEFELEYYPVVPVFMLALGALLLLVVAQIMATAAVGCCRPRTGASETQWAVGITFSVLIAALIAGEVYLRVVALIAPTMPCGVDRRCYVLKSGVLTRAAVLSFVAAVLGIKSYITLTRAPALAAATTTATAGTEPKSDGPYLPATRAPVGLSQWPAQGYRQARHHAQGNP
ncbi:hypothetical protein EJB05_35679, partial [Eragrostis curvula]